MMHEKLKKLTDEDLAKVQGGQIYKFFLEDNKKPQYILATPTGPVKYASFLKAAKDAPNYMYVNIEVCESLEDAEEKAKKDSEIYSVISVFPFI